MTRRSRRVAGSSSCGTARPTTTPAGSGRGSSTPSCPSRGVEQARAAGARDRGIPTLAGGRLRPGARCGNGPARRRGCRGRGDSRPALARDPRGPVAGAVHEPGALGVCRRAGADGRARTSARGVDGETLQEVGQRAGAALRELLDGLARRTSASSSWPTASPAARPLADLLGLDQLAATHALADAGELPLGRGRRTAAWAGRSAPGTPPPDLRDFGPPADLENGWGYWVNFRSPPRGHSHSGERGCGAVGSALPWHGRGQGFESPQLHRTKDRPPGRFARWTVFFVQPYCQSMPRRFFVRAVRGRADPSTSRSAGSPGSWRA